MTLLEWTSLSVATKIPLLVVSLASEAGQGGGQPFRGASIPTTRSKPAGERKASEPNSSSPSQVQDSWGKNGEVQKVVLKMRNVDERS